MKAKKSTAKKALLRQAGVALLYVCVFWVVAGQEGLVLAPAFGGEHSALDANRLLLQIGNLLILFFVVGIGLLCCTAIWSRWYFFIFGLLLFGAAAWFISYLFGHPSSPFRYIRIDATFIRSHGGEQGKAE